MTSNFRPPGLTSANRLASSPRDAIKGASSFDPASLPNLRLWLDANDAAQRWQEIAGTTPATANNDLIGKWGDKSGNGYHATATADDGSRMSLATNVQNSLPVVRAATGDLLKNLSLPWNSNAHTDFIVCRYTSFVANSGFLVHIPSSGSDFDGNTGAPLQTSAAISAAVSNLTTSVVVTIAANTWMILSVHWSAGTCILRINGGSASTDAAITPGSSSGGYLLNGRYVSGAIDAGFRMGADYGEVVMCSSALDTTNSNLLGAALATKWGLSWTAIP